MGLDSVEFLLVIEEEFDMSIPDEISEKLQTPRDLIAFIKRTRRFPAGFGGKVTGKPIRTRADVSRSVLSILREQSGLKHPKENDKFYPDIWDA